jgi:hypothetical protein
MAISLTAIPRHVVNRRRLTFEQSATSATVKISCSGEAVVTSSIPAWDTVTTKDAGRVTLVVGFMVLLGAPFVQSFERS